MLSFSQSNWTICLIRLLLGVDFEGDLLSLLVLLGVSSFLFVGLLVVKLLLGALVVLRFV